MLLAHRELGWRRMLLRRFEQVATGPMATCVPRHRERRTGSFAPHSACPESVCPPRVPSVEGSLPSREVTCGSRSSPPRTQALLTPGAPSPSLASPTEAHARSSDIRSAGGRRATRGPPSSRERDGLEVRPAGAEAEEWGAPWAPWSEQLGTEPSERLGGGAVFANASAAMDPVSGHLHGSPGSRWTSTTSPHPGRKDPARRARSTSLIRSARGK